jgi:hypothetical protein
MILPTIAHALLIIAGLLLPGLGWARGLRAPTPWLAAGLLSVAAIFAGVLAGVVSGIPVNVWTLATWLAAVSAGGLIFARRNQTAPAPAPGWSGVTLALSVAPMLAVACWRATVQALPGADADFRWDRLAVLLVQHGHLDFYPPVTPEGFARYFWADGIAPLVSGLYAWTYLAAGSTAKTWTAIPVLLQVAGLLALLRALGELIGGARAGWFACALGGATMLLQFAFSLGQETGFTALGAGGMILYLLHWEKSRQPGLLVLAATGATLAALAREYGAIFALIGAGWMIFHRAGWRPVAGFVLAAAALPMVWHGRNWLLTGNPLYAQSLGGLFRENPVFTAWMQGYVETYGAVLRSAAGWREIGRLLAFSAVPAFAGLVAAAACRLPQGRFALAVAAASFATWLASVPYTSGGLFYSMRVLSPLLLVGCAWGGAALASLVPARKHLAGLLAGLWLFGLDAALRAWTIPVNPYMLAPRDWPKSGYWLQDDFAREQVPFLEAAARAASGKILSESAGLQHVFNRCGKDLVPLWSPDVAFLFGPELAGADAVSRLHALGYSHLLLTRAPASVDFLKRTGALDRLAGRLQAVLANDTYVLFALTPEPAPPPVRPP